MGIPYLGTVLTPAAERLTASREHPVRVYVDGPSLAFQIFKAFEFLQPVSAPYQEYALLARVFLRALISRGLDIKAVIFDGALPASKRHTRLGRLTENIKCLSKPKLRGWLVHPSFTVPLLQDILQNEFSHLFPSFTVPGEADDYLVSLVINSSTESEPCYVLSSDSDFLIFDLGPYGGTVNLTLLTADLSQDVIDLSVIRSHRLAEMLHNVPVWRIAFAFNKIKSTKRGKYTFLHLEELAATVSETDPDAVEMKMSYILPPDIPTNLAELKTFLSKDIIMQRCPNMYIGRITEVFFPTMLADWKDGAPSEHLYREVFLPYLFEDSDRAPCWEIGRRWRRNVYAKMLAPELERGPVSVFEVSRSGQRVAANEIRLRSTHDTSLHDNELSESDEYASDDSENMEDHLKYDPKDPLSVIIRKEIIYAYYRRGQTLTKEEINAIDGYFEVVQQADSVLFAKDSAALPGDNPSPELVDKIAHNYWHNVDYSPSNGSLLSPENPFFAIHDQLTDGWPTFGAGDDYNGHLREWSWRAAHLFAQIQAAVYSLFCMKLTECADAPECFVHLRLLQGTIFYDYFHSATTKSNSKRRKQKFETVFCSYKQSYGSQ